MKKEDVSLSRKQREKQRHQEEIFAAARTLFARSSYESTTMEDIARSAQFAKGTLYNLFESKEDLFVSLMHHEFDKLNILLRTITEENAEPIKALNKLTRTQLEFFQDHFEFFKIMTGESIKISAILHGKKAKMVRDKHIEHYQIITDFFKKAKNNGLDTAFEPQFLALSLIGIVRSVSLFYLLESGKSGTSPDLTLKAGNIVDLLLGGILKKGNNTMDEKDV